jgi:UMF1 family MFS transporter
LRGLHSAPRFRLARQVAFALALVALSNYFFGTGENLIAAFLPELAESRAMGRVSGWGWAFGYLGGLVALGICLFYLMSSGQEASRAVPVTMVITAAFFAVAAVPTFVFLRSGRCRRPPSPTPGSASRDAQGISTLPRPAAVPALHRVLPGGHHRGGLASRDLRRAGHEIQHAANHHAHPGGERDRCRRRLRLRLRAGRDRPRARRRDHARGMDRDGRPRGTTQTVSGFWIAANLAGLCMGSSQAAGRAIVGYLAPPARLAEFFGLWGLAVKAASIFGP